MKSKKGKKKTKILIVEDHPVVRQGLTGLINCAGGLLVCGEADNAREAMLSVEKLNPDLVIVDISLKSRSGLELIKDINVQRPDLPILVLSVHDESIYAERVLRAGARGYVMKQEAAELVIAAVRHVLSGEIYLSDDMTKKILHRFVKTKNNSPSQLFSDRELEIFELLGRGLNTHQIAEKLNLSKRTIDTYQIRIKEKLNIRTSMEMVRQAAQWVHIENEN